ncbi:MAG: tetratricopeptide repeat protein [Flavobacteriaceae bacterium]|nr:MAG: tetratricopeptide repeat protein [Flavobacteriaceae bacterium]
MKISFQIILFFLMTMIACEKESKNEAYREISDVSHADSEGYLGDASCISCHDSEYETWQGSHHDKAMQIVSDSTVLGDFNDVKVTIDGVSYEFFKKAEGFMIKVKELDGSEAEFKLAYVFGITPLQQYIVDFPNGKKQVLRVTWDTLENKWFHQYAGDKITITDWLHWTRGAQNWNTMCAECHSTNLKKSYFVEKDSFHTTYSSINVSCESCHGPGKKHVQWANSNQKKGEMHMILGDDQKSQLNMCAPCHARRMKLTKNLIPGNLFENQYLIQNISSEYYHLDGQILEEDYVYGSFLQSKMHMQGIKCGDCHDVHSNKLKLEGNKLCLQCHVPEKYESKSHHFHEMNSESAQCINCHMTGRYYMGNDFRRDHSFRIPRPDQSVAYGTPNACNECHQDQSEEWASSWVEKWYGKERAPHFSDYLLLSHQNEISQEDRLKLDEFINDLNYPFIARSTVIGNLTFSGEDQIKSLLTALNDSSAVVRYHALMQFRSMAPQDRLAIAQKHLTDKAKLVRIGSAQLLIGFNGDGWSETDKLNLHKANEEFEYMLFANADFSTGRLQLGDYFMQNNDVRSAIKHYSKALEMDSLLFPVYTNLATAYSLNQNTEGAFETLNTWMDYQPDAGRPYYLRALLNFELGNNEIGVEDLKMAIELDPQDIRSMYNLATFYYQNKEFESALEEVRQALKIDPSNQDVKYLNALILKELGRIEEANAIIRELQSS